MLNKKFALILPTIFLILSISVLAINVNWAPGVPDEGNGEEPPPSLIKTYDSTLQIKEINVKVDGKKATITNNGEKIPREAKQESDLEFEIEVKNIFEKEIKNIAITATIKDIDDLKEESDIYKLAPGDSKKVDFDFKLPLKLDDGDYDFKINLRGKDQDNNIHKLDWALTLEVEKDKHNVRITKASVSPSVVSCSKATNAIVEILNLGSEEEDVKLEITNRELGIDIKERDIELGTGTHDDAEYEKTFPLTVQNSIKAGTYPISINAYYNKDKSITAKKVNLVVEDCIKQKQSLTQTKNQPSNSQTTAKPKTKKPSTIISTQTDESIILLLTLSLVIVLGLIIFLLGVIIIQLRR